MTYFPKGPFAVVYADPAWSFKTFSDKGKDKSPDKHYDCMSLDEICALPVRESLADDAVLFLWATWPLIFRAERAIDAWGFKYSGLAWEWLKFNFDSQKFAFGCGYGTRKNLEPLLLARRGSPILKNKSTRDFMFAARREHSRKPDENYERIESMFDGPYLEMFARTERPGWTAWGNQTTKFPALTTPPASDIIPTDEDLLADLLG